MRHKYLFFVAAAAALAAGQARADFIIDSPAVEQGEWWLGTNNSFDFDSRNDVDGAREHLLAVGYGVTDWWYVELEGALARGADRSYGYTGTGINNVFQFWDSGAYWLDAGGELNYAFSHEDQTADALQIRLLLEKAVGEFTHTANIVADREVGDHREGGTSWSVFWKTQYAWQPLLNPGIEYYAGLGEIDDSGDWDSQDHRLGPVIYGEFENGLGYELGWLFGFSDGAADHTLKLNFGYGFSL